MTIKTIGLALCAALHPMRVSQCAAGEDDFPDRLSSGLGFGYRSAASRSKRQRLELLKETSPKVVQVAVIGTASRHGTSQALKEMELAAGMFAVRLSTWDIQDAKI